MAHGTGRTLAERVRSAVLETSVLDVHTHIYPPDFGGLLLWGIDELLTYHYLVAEVYRVAPMPYDRFWAMTTAERADYIWKHLFIERSPVSEACRGILTCLKLLGLDPGARDLNAARAWFRERDVNGYIDTVFAAAGVKRVVMTNDPFDDAERAVWQRRETPVDARFLPALRIDRLLMDWENACGRLREWGYDVEPRLGDWTAAEVRRFLDDWIARMGPVYMAASLPPDFAYPEDSLRGLLLDRCVLPTAREHNLPVALMIGVRKLVNPGLRLAGDSLGKAAMPALEHLCEENPDTRFLVTMLSRENQHELAVTARKFPNLMIFGCWWFLNNPSVIDEITRERLELLGLSFIPQHSDARVLDQLMYKWRHSREIIARVLADTYTDLEASGWTLSDGEIKRDVRLLFGGNFETFVCPMRGSSRHNL